MIDKREFGLPEVLSGSVGVPKSVNWNAISFILFQYQIFNAHFLG